ncbi:leucine--tRNA ligase [Candidatus Peregrinibacteria bacterium]|nr:leucine--tRNA ligase [Candidatus Peregrinibacteria bacterium]
MADIDPKSFDHKTIEKKWQKYWLKNKTFRAPDDSKKEKYYVLDMFPYPSSAGLHVGHPLGYTATDIMSRYLRMNGKNVLHPMGWDAFGLPAENYAIKTKVHPEKTTSANIETFRRQIQDLGFTYDWDREVNTCVPEYYKWTQWFFAFLYKNNLAYRKDAPVNWCESCQTVLANEQVVNGKCERCKNDVIQKKLEQWFFRITDFIEDDQKTSGLLSGLEKIDWPNSTKIAQMNWIGRQEGINIFYDVIDSSEKIATFTKYPETNFGATFIVVAPEHPIVSKITTPEHKKEVEKYLERTFKMTELQRTETTEKTGAFTGSYAFNPLNKKKMPIYVADFVLAHYGTGMVVGVPGHDERDFEFAKNFDLEIIRVMKTSDGDISPVTKLEQVDHEGIMMNSEFLNGMDAQKEAKKAMMDSMEKEGMGKRVVFYNLRDWLVSRQRYWGAPIPIVYDDAGNHYLLPEDELPVKLPTDVDFMPKGESPLAKSTSFHDKKELERIEKKLKKSGDLSNERTIVRRESDTMDTFVCSSWYMFRFMDPNNTKEFASKEMMKKWGPIDLYVGGAEHTVLHLLYARFFTKVLHKYGYIDYDEPFQKLRHQGMILGEDGQKMSKSIGNVINPDEVVNAFGADTLRCYEMFMGPFHQKKPWSMGAVEGVRKFLDRTYRVFQKSITPLGSARGDDELRITDKNLQSLLHKTIKIVTEHIQEFRFNTALSQMMILTNELTKSESVSREILEKFVLILAPFAPHLAEELWGEVLGHKESLTYEPWPKYDEKYLVEESVTYVVQVNGKLRGDFTIEKTASQEEVIAQAKTLEKVKKYLEEGKIVKEIFVPEKIVGFVVK